MKEKKQSSENKSVRAQVLIIDDEESLRKAMAYELAKANFGVTTADNGESGYELAKSCLFDIAITDLRMPRMDGLQTLVALKQIDPYIEVIVLTGYATLDTAISCLKQGAYDYLQKPVNMTELCLMLDKALEKRRLQGMVTLYEATQALQSTLEKPVIVQLGLDLAKKVADTQSVTIVLKSDKRTEINRGESSIRLSRNMLNEITDEIAVNHNLILFNRPRDSSETVPDWLDPKVGSLMGFPLIGRNEVMGALVFARKSGVSEFTTEEIQRGSIFAMQLALTLDNAQLYGKLEQKLAELDKTRTKLKFTQNKVQAAESGSAKNNDPHNPFRYVINRI